MKKLLILPLALALSLGSGVAHADDDLTEEQEKKVKAVLSTIGCDGWEEVEIEDNGYVEIEDAKCKMGKMDIKLDSDMNVVLISRH